MDLLIRDIMATNTRGQHKSGRPANIKEMLGLSIVNVQWRDLFPKATV